MSDARKMSTEGILEVCGEGRITNVWIKKTSKERSQTIYESVKYTSVPQGNQHPCHRGRIWAWCDGPTVPKVAAQDQAARKPVPNLRCEPRKLITQDTVLPEMETGVE